MVVVVAQAHHGCSAAIVPLRLCQYSSTLAWLNEWILSGALALVWCYRMSENSMHLASCASLGMLDRFFSCMPSQVLINTINSILSDFDSHD